MSNKENNIDEIISKTFSHIKDIVDANTVVGKTIKLSENIFIIPVSKINVGLISGGGNISNKNSVTMGSSTGFNIVPIGFVTITNKILDFIPVNSDNTTKDIIDNLFKLSEIIINKENETYEK